MKKTIILSVLALSLMACCAKKENNVAQVEEASTAAEKPTSEIQELKSGTHGGRETASNEVIKSQVELERLYQGLNWGSAPQIDFTRTNVIALFMGQKSSGGYKIGIGSLYVKGGIATVKVSRTSPDGMATSVMTQPYYVAAITKTEKVVFE